MILALRSTLRSLWCDITSGQWWCLLHFWAFVDFVLDDYEEAKVKVLPRPDFERDLLWSFKTELLKIMRPMVTTRKTTILATVGYENAEKRYKLVLGCHTGLYSPTRGGEIAVIVLKGDKLEMSYYVTKRSRYSGMAATREKVDILFELANPDCHKELAKIVWDIIKIPR